MNEEELQSSIETYKSQLSQVTQALQAAGPNADLETLKTDLEELIKLTEDSLLSLRKSQLLKDLDEESVQHSTEASTQKNTALDQEYAAFQELLSDDLSSDPAGAGSSRHNTQSPQATPPQTPGNQTNDSFADIYKDIVGTKCRAPYTHEWGQKTYGNALIAGIDSQSDLDMPKALVMFCNPTHAAMLPCKYYLSGNCRFQQQECRYSHGHPVELEDLEQYREPDYSALRLESKCLARYDVDDLWYKATVVSLPEGDQETDDHSVMVMFDTYEDEAVTLPLEDVLPLDVHAADDSSDDDITDTQPISREESDDDDLPVFLWRPPSHGLGDLGQWEAHTKGIGSRLLTKMGYVPGQGLGRHGEGRVQPVPIQLLPQGKSLDKIMELKAVAGDRDMYDVMKRQEKHQKKHTEKLAKQYQQQTRPDVFDFINKKLGHKKGKLSELIHHHEGEGHSPSVRGQGRLHRNISEQDLQAKSDRNINIQLLKTGEEMKSVEKELAKLRQSLSRNDRDKTVSARLRDKISSLETYLNKLKSSESTMQNHQKKRSDHKKLTVF